MLNTQRILEIIKENGYSCSSIEKSLGFGNGAIRRWETNSPSINKLYKLSDFLNVSITYLLNEEEQKESSGEGKELLEQWDKLTERQKGEVTGHIKEMLNQNQVREKELYAKKKTLTEFKKSETIDIRVYDQKATAGLGNYLSEDTSYEIETFDKEKVPSNADFGIRISGDSMQPEIQDGDTVWVKEQIAIENGEIGIFILNGEAYCKQLKIDRKKKLIHLVSINPDYEPKEVKPSDDLKTIGRVII